MEWESHIIALYEKFHYCCFAPPYRLCLNPDPRDRTNRGTAPHKYPCSGNSCISHQNKYPNGSATSDRRAITDR